MNESILTSIKKLLGISEVDTSFDADILMHINSIFVVLWQMGVGPKQPFSITSENETWSDFLPDISEIEMIKSYIYLRVAQLFDPPNSSFVSESQKNLISELEWRLYTAADSNIV